MDFTQQLIGKIEKYCQKNELLPDGNIVLCACSGGPDSMALLDIFLRLQEQRDAAGKTFKVAAAHFEHGIRGEASLADASFVRAFCKKNNVEIYMASADVPAEAKKNGESLETAARRLRYEFLYSISHQLKGALIATAHHADDQAETVLMHLLRGSGTNGLGGIRPRNGLLIRPLLCVSKEQLVEYCRRRGIEYRIDATNNIPDCLRNKIRLELMPLLKQEYNGNAVEALNRLAKSSAEDEAFLQAETRRIWKNVILSNGQEGEGRPSGTENIRRMDRGALIRTPAAIQSRIMQRVALELTGRALQRNHIDICREWLVKGESGTGLELPFGIRVRRQYEKIIFYIEDCGSRGSASSNTIAGVRAEAVETAEGCGEIPENMESLGKLECKILSRRPVGSFGVDAILCDADKLKFPLSLRTRRPGDIIQLPAGRKKLKDFFIDIKLPREQRDVQPLVISGETIIWLPGLRQAKIAWTDANTRRYAVISYKSV